LGEKQRVRIDAQVCEADHQISASVVGRLQSCERRHKSLSGHHYTPVKSLSLPLNNPVGPQAWRGFSLLLADFVLPDAPRFTQDLSCFVLSFSVSCELEKSRVHKMTLIEIKDLKKNLV
jgi:hypothetical protein